MNSNLNGQKRVCIVSYANPYLYPYFQIYVQHILRLNAKSCFLYWNRYKGGLENDRRLYPQSELICYNEELPIGTGGGLSKIISYIKATRFIKKILKEQHFDKIIFAGSTLAIFCFGCSPNNYKDKYIVDIRDYSVVNEFWVYRLFQLNILKKAFGNVISSPAYKCFLPDLKYILAHNYTKYPELVVDQFKANINKEPISITYVGTVRFFEQDKKLLNLFGNDKRYKICYYGSGSDVLKNYCEEKNYENVDFIGTFPQSETVNLYKETTLVNNLYGNHNKSLDYALSNKLYHAAQLHRPILVCPDTYMEEISKEYNLGIVVDLDNPQTPDLLYSEFINFNWEDFHKGCDSFIKTVEEDNSAFNSFIESFIKS